MYHMTDYVSMYLQSRREMVKVELEEHDEGAPRSGSQGGTAWAYESLSF